LLQQVVAQSLRSDGEAVVVAFDALGDTGQEGVFLRVPDHLGQAVIDRPGAAADGAGKKGLIETVGMEADFLVLVMFAYGALHGESPFALRSCRPADLVK